jgi:hypothetical protein
MSQTRTTAPTSNLANLGNVVPAGYSYYQKLTTPGRDLSLPNAYLKWYDIRPPQKEIAPEHIEETRAFITAETQAGRLTLEGDLGFVLLHLCDSVLLLMVNTWRSTNEIWESAYTKDLTQPGSYHLNTFPTSHRATFCVWELGAVWHERNAWMQFLSSPRDDQAKLAYINDRFTGLV